jgi:hypothetical protein
VIAAALEQGKPVPESLIPPRVGEIEAPFWDGFAALRAAQARGKADPLPLVDILAWCDLTGISDPASRRDFHDIIRAMDQAWRGEVADDERVPA